MDSPKHLYALLGALARRSLFGDTSITKGELKAELFPDVAEEEFAQRCQQYEELLASIASEDMDFTHAEAFLRQAGLDDVQVEVFVRLWKAQRTKIHETLVGKATWNNRLEAFNWRLDVKTKSRHVAQLNDPAAILELKIADPIAKTSELVRFEVDQQKLAFLRGQVEAIEKAITSVASVDAKPQVRPKPRSASQAAE